MRLYSANLKDVVKLKVSVDGVVRVQKFDIYSNETAAFREIKKVIGSGNFLSVSFDTGKISMANVTIIDGCEGVAFVKIQCVDNEHIELSSKNYNAENNSYWRNSKNPIWQQIQTLIYSNNFNQQACFKHKKLVNDSMRLYLDRTVPEKDLYI